MTTYSKFIFVSSERAWKSIHISKKSGIKKMLQSLTETNLHWGLKINVVCKECFALFVNKAAFRSINPPCRRGRLLPIVACQTGCTPLSSSKWGCRWQTAPECFLKKIPTVIKQHHQLYVFRLITFTKLGFVIWKSVFFSNINFFNTHRLFKSLSTIFFTNICRRTIFGQI